MDTYNTRTTYEYFLDCVLNSRIEMGEESETGEDNFLNVYLARTLTSKLVGHVGPISGPDINEITCSSMGNTEKILRLQREGDKGMIFWGIFTNETRNYGNVGRAYSLAAALCGKTHHPGEEIFEILDEKLDFCMDLLHYFSLKYLPVRKIPESELYRMTLPQTPEDSLDSYLDYYSMLEKEKDPERKKLLKFHLGEARKVAQSLNPTFIFPEVD